MTGARSLVTISGNDEGLKLKLFQMHSLDASPDAQRQFETKGRNCQSSKRVHDGEAFLRTASS